MIISASRRTDIPAFYAEWFLNRLRAGHAVARNPMNPRSARAVSLKPGDVDACVFWSKDFRPMLNHLPEILGAFPVAVQHTLTPYQAPLEPRLTDKRAIVDGMLALSRAIGPDCLVWRYDPIVLSDRFTPERHLRAFERACALLGGATRRCVISFVKIYPRARRAMEGLSRAPSPGEMRALADELSGIARAHGMALSCCCPPEGLDAPGVRREGCISAELIAAATGSAVAPRRDPGQRSGCLCLPSVDIGAYRCCPHMCAYCYANASAAVVERNHARHDPQGEELLPYAPDIPAAPAAGRAGVQQSAPPGPVGERP